MSYTLDYQYGGENEDTSFFNNFIDLYQQQNEDISYEENPEHYEENLNQNIEEDYSQDNSAALEERIKQIEDILSERQDSVPKSGYNGDDSFLNFLFQEDNSNEPLRYSDVNYQQNVSFKKENISNSEGEAFNYLLEKGYPKHIAAGIVGNLQYESNLNPNAVGDNGKAKGIAQWHPDRYNNLVKQGYNLKTLKGNLDAIHSELSGPEKKAFEKLLKTKTPEEAAIIFDKYYERSSGLTTSKRANRAMNIYNKYQYGGGIDSNLYIAPSKIQGEGLYSNNNLRKGEVLGISHIDSIPTLIGSKHNHSTSPNLKSLKLGNSRYLIVNKPIKSGQELTIDYREQPELEQPENF